MLELILIDKYIASLVLLTTLCVAIDVFSFH